MNRLSASALAHRFGGALVALALSPLAHGALFEDDEARKAILDLRQRLEQASEQNRTEQAQALAKLTQQNQDLAEQVSQLRRSLLQLNNDNEALRAELAKMRGQDEQIAREVADLQRRQSEVVKGVDERVRRLEPQKVVVDGKEFLADPEEKRLFEDALGIFRRGDFGAAAGALTAFQQRYPASGYTESVLFWLGNAQYGQRNYKEAIASFRALVSNSPSHSRAPEALLSIANCQIELKDSKTARRTLDELVKAYPTSEAANAGRERLASLK
jgi:tol-pal system protein YbgF